MPVPDYTPGVHTGRVESRCIQQRRNLMVSASATEDLRIGAVGPPFPASP